MGFCLRALMPCLRGAVFYGYKICFSIQLSNFGNGPNRVSNMTPDQKWQVILVLWGTKYPVSDVSHLIATIRAQSNPAPARVVLLTDHISDGLGPDVIQRQMPEFFLRPEFKGSGCQAKLCIFEKGLVPPDMPAIFVDIDTVVFGNLARLLGVMDNRKTVAILQSAILPFSSFARFLHRVTLGQRYARGNSSIVVFHPAECTHIARRFRELEAQHGPNGVRPMIADERFMSWANQPNMRAIPRRMAVKLPTEFMLPWRWLILRRASLPWVRRRWNGLIAVTLPGIEVKGEALLTLADGADIIDRKGRRLIWSEAALGPVKMQLENYYRILQANKDTPQ